MPDVRERPRFCRSQCDVQHVPSLFVACQRFLSRQRSGRILSKAPTVHQDFKRQLPRHAVAFKPAPLGTWYWEAGIARDLCWGSSDLQLSFQKDFKTNKDLSILIVRVLEEHGVPKFLVFNSFQFYLIAIDVILFRTWRTLTSRKSCWAISLAMPSARRGQRSPSCLASAIASPCSSSNFKRKRFFHHLSSFSSFDIFEVPSSWSHEVCVRCELHSHPLRGWPLIHSCRRQWLRNHDISIWIDSISIDIN